MRRHQQQSRFNKLRRVAECVQSYVRAQQSRQLAAKLHVAYLVQPSVRSFFAHRSFANLRSGVILAQAMWRGREARRYVLLLHFCDT